ncbi:MAG: hypothetical protein KDA91_19195 [Planctomycetaceae bacterium]|nr:hypothetical protein [Planctomycetaceae bacterium]
MLTSAYKKRLLARILLVVVLLAVSALRPRINAWLGGEETAGVDVTEVGGADVPRPEIRAEPRNDDPERAGSGNAPATAELDLSDVVIPRSPYEDDTASPSSANSVRVANKNRDEGAGSSRKDDSSGISSSRLGDRASDSKSRTSGNAQPEPDSATGRTADKSGDIQLGQFTEIRNNTFRSSAGLIYPPGSADGHRLRHVMKHAKDDTSKPVHGVFDGDGDRDVVFALIDKAWVKAKKGGRDVRKERQNDRLVYTVRMDNRVGYVGGREGQRQKNPECRFIRIVIEDESTVVSAYPTRSF